MRAAIALSRECLARVRVRPRRGRRAALARWQGRVSAVAHKRPNHSVLELFLSLIHISEPTRRYAISYAVFCLKKKKRMTAGL